jgi:hypothetical protein
MERLPELLAVIGDYEMQRRQLIDSNERLVTILRGLIAGDLLPEHVDPETFEVTGRVERENGRVTEPV